MTGVYIVAQMHIGPEHHVLGILFCGLAAETYLFRQLKCAISTGFRKKTMGFSE